ncbi:hypothetical protein [Streptomyces sp. NPDC000851]
MSTPPHYGNGANGAYEPAGPPNVYHPQAAPSPEYDEYADPAVAHGWQNAYDETRELPPVADSESGEGGAIGEGRGGGRAGADAHRSGSGRRSRRKPGPWRSRRAAVAAGAVGAVSAAALIAGFSFSGSPSGTQGKGDRTGSTTGESEESAAPTEPGRASASDAARTDSPSGAGKSSTAPSPSASGSDPAGTTKDPSTGSPTADVTTSSAPVTATAPPGRSKDNPGHGQGGTKGPK